jgi:hypothetical protein
MVVLPVVAAAVIAAFVVVVHRSSALLSTSSRHRRRRSCRRNIYNKLCSIDKLARGLPSRRFPEHPNQTLREKSSEMEAIRHNLPDYFAELPVCGL